MILGWIVGFAVAIVISVVSTLLFWPHDPTLAFLVGIGLGSTLPPLVAAWFVWLEN